MPTSVCGSRFRSRTQEKGVPPMNTRARRFDVALLLTCLLAAPGYGLAQSYQATPLEPDTSYSLRAKGISRRGMTSVLVKLDADALASYAGGLPGLQATSPR